MEHMKMKRILKKTIALLLVSILAVTSSEGGCLLAYASDGTKSSLQVDASEEQADMRDSISVSNPTEEPDVPEAAGDVETETEETESSEGTEECELNVPLAAAGSATSGACGSSLTWNYDSDTCVLTISGTGEMKEYSYYSSVPWYSYRGSIVSVILQQGVASISSYAFYNCTSLSEITIPDSVTAIGKRAFYNCDSLTAIEIPGSVITIGDDAFCDSGITELTLCDGVEEIGDCAFESCRITELVIPDSVKIIGSEAFLFCSYLGSVTIGSGVTAIGQEAFMGTAVQTFTVAAGNQYYQSIDGVLFDKNMVLIAYPGGNGKTFYMVPEGTTAIGESAFYSVSDLTEIVIPDSVTSISDYAFGLCAELITADLGEGLVEIGDFGFYLCMSLENVTLPDSLNRIGNWAFERTKISEITIGANMASIGYGPFNACYNLEEIEVSSENENFKAVDGVLFSSDGTVLVQYPCGREDASYDIPDGVVEINGGAFNNCNAIYSVTFPDTLESIGFMAFYACENLGTIVFPASLAYLGSYVFGYANCPTAYYFKGNMPELNYSFDTKDTVTVYYPKGDSTWDLYAEVNDWGTLAYKMFGTSVTFDTWDTPVVMTTSLPKCTVTLSQNSYTYNGYAHRPSVTVTNGSYTLICGTDYTVSYSDNTDVGTATVTIKGIGSYTGSVKKTFTIAKASQSMTASISTSSIKVGKTATITVSGVGTITYKSGNTSVATVSSSGVVTGVKAGTATITVTAAGNSNYKSASRTISVTVKSTVTNGVSIETLTYGFSNSAAAFGYKCDSSGTCIYVIPLSSYQIIYSAQQAMTLYNAHNTYWGGNCYGMSSTSCLFNISGDDLIITDFRSSADNLSDLKVSDTSSALELTLTQLIEAFHVSQYSSAVQERYQYKRTSKSENLTVLSEICEAVQEVDNGGTPVVLGMLGTYGHAIVAYKYEKVSSTKEYLYVYDCNYPGKERKITLTKDNSGTYTGWSYTTTYSSANYYMTYIPYDVYAGVWESRSSTSGSTSVSNSLNSTESLLTVSSENFELLNLEGNVLGIMEDGSFTSYNDEIYMVVELDGNDDSSVSMFYLPTDSYQIVDTSGSDDEIDISMVNVDQSISVTTQADGIEIVVDDSQAAAVVNMDGIAGELYEVEINSNLEYAEGTESVSYSGRLDGEETTVGTAYGEMIADNYTNSGVYVNDTAYNFSFDDTVDISDYTASLSGTSFAYTGEAIEPGVTITGGGAERELVEGTDFVVVYTSNVNAGKAMATVYGINGYDGKIELPFTVTLAKCSVSYVCNTMDGLKAAWNEVEGATGYYIYRRNTDGTYNSAPTATVTGSTTTTWTDPQVLTGGQDYTYKVAAYYRDSAGTIILGASGTTKTCKYLKGGEVTSVANTSSGPKVTWTKVAGANGYYVYRMAAGGDYELAATVSGTSVVSWTDTSSLTSGKNYTYKVAPFFKNSSNQVTKGGAKTTKTVKYLTAGKISSLSNTSGGIYIKWTKVTGATGYYVYRKASGAGSYTLVKTITSVGTVSYTDTGVAGKNNVTYTYYVQPYYKSSAGVVTKAGYTTKTIVRLKDTSISSLTNSASKTMAVKWSAKSGVTGYQIQYSTSSGFASGNKTVTVTGASSTGKTIASLTKGKTYYVRIRTYKTVNGTTYYSAWSAVKSVKISK